MDQNELSRRSEDGNATQGMALFRLGVLLASATIALLTGFSLYQSLEDRGNLRLAMTNLDAPHQQAVRLRGQVENIAKQIARLAEQGNPNAREIVDALRRQGITINPN